MLLLLLLSCSNKYKNNVNELFDSIDNKESPGCIIAVLKDGEFIYQNEFGMANIENNIPIKSDTKFNLASVSKQFTAYSAFILEDRGQLSLQDDIRIYLPELSGFDQIIKIEDLIYHTSGLRDSWYLYALSGNMRNIDGSVGLIEPVYTDDLVGLISNQTDLNFKPGKSMTYCNTGYELLSEIISRVSGKSFKQFTHDEIFSKLDMDDSGFVDELNIESQISSYYLSPENEYKIYENLEMVLGASQLHSTMEDLVKWLTFLNKGIKNNDRIISKMIKPKMASYAAGIRIGDFNGYTSYGHDGNTASFKSEILVVPELDLSYIFLSNNKNIHPLDFTSKVLDIIVNEKVYVYESVDINENYIISDKTIENYSNKYYIEELGLTLEFDVKNGKLVLSSNSPFSRKGNLIPLNDNTFYNDTFSTKYIFLNESHSTPNLYMESQDITYKARRITDTKENELHKYIGTFYNDELDIIYTIELNNNQLSTTTKDGQVIELYCFSSNILYGDSWYFTHLSFKNNYTEFSLSAASNSRGTTAGSSARNIKFLKIE